MSALSQSRCLAGSRAFTGIRPRQVAQVSNGCKVFMRRKDSYMVEVNLGEEEPEDIAVRRFMKAVMDSKLLEKLRTRRYKESKIELYKIRMRERHEIRKLGLVEPTWEEVNGDDPSPKVFDEFFSMDPDGEFGMTMGQDDSFMGAYNDSMWGGYMDGQNRGTWEQGGYMDQSAAGGYINQGAFSDQGGYINADTSSPAPGTGMVNPTSGEYNYSAPQ
ncbi:hypothetical protein FOA52_014271 [Chlamydomonas sp. UWO 241]|nr:hypothetical protein FOA52_014271 [Chlamydomonas sp. UWO 241]